MNMENNNKKNEQLLLDMGLSVGILITKLLVFEVMKIDEKML